MNTIPNTLNGDVLDVEFDEIVEDKDVEKTETEIKTYESIEELQFFQDYEGGDINVLDDLSENEMNDPCTQKRF